MSETVITRGDARAMPAIDTDTVDLIVTSPPYWGLRSYRDDDQQLAGQIGLESSPAEYVEAVASMIDDEWRRVLKPAGSLWLNLGDRYFQKSLLGLPWRIAQWLLDCGWFLRAEVIWSKPNPMPETVHDRVRRTHEQLFHFTLEESYFAALDEIRVPHSPASLERMKHGYGDRSERNSARLSTGYDAGGDWIPNPLGKVPGSVWDIPAGGLLIADDVREHLDLPGHFAAFPQELPRRIILGWSPPAGLVLDPFGGSGTTAGVARVLGRSAISVDLSDDYCRLARWRVFQSDHFSKSEQRTWADKQGTLI